MSLPSPRVWEYSWRDYPIQHASSMSPHSRTPHALRLFVCACVVCVCVYSIIGPVGDGGSCGHKPTWNFLNKGLIFTESCKVFEGVSFPSTAINSAFRHLLTPLTLMFRRSGGQKYVDTVKHSNFGCVVCSVKRVLSCFGGIIMRYFSNKFAC